MMGKIFVGVDGGYEAHVCVALNESEQVIWQEEIVNDHAGCDRVLDRVREWQAAGSEVWVGAEGIGGYLSPWDARLIEGGCRYVNIPALQVKRFREAIFFQADKDDEKDAFVIAKILHWQVVNGQARVSKKKGAYFETLKETARAFTRISESKVAAQNQLVNAVRTYWPELVITGGYFSRMDGAGFLTLLSNYPTPGAVSRAGRSRIRKLLSHATRSDQTELADRLVSEARLLRKVVEVPAPKARLVQNLAESVLGLSQVVKALATELEEQLEQHPFGAWLLEQKGIGPRTAGCFLGEAGDLGRFEGEEKLARYAGTGAVKSQSGKSAGHHWDGHRYNHRLKRALLLMAQCRAREHAPSSEYVRARQHSKKEYWKTIKKLARHLVRFLWRSWRKVVEIQHQADYKSTQKA
ncbi:MAG: IS110 family transposase [bacterium]